MRRRKAWFVSQAGGHAHASAAQAARHYEERYPSGRFLTLLRGLVGEH